MNINHPTPEQIGALRGLWQEAFGDTNEYLDCFFATAFDEKRCLVVDRADAACYWLDCTCRGQKIAYLDIDRHTLKAGGRNSKSRCGRGSGYNRTALARQKP